MRPMPMYLAAALAIPFVSASARADSMACDGRIVASGDSTYEVRSRCGQPDDATTRVEVRTVRERVRVPCGDGGRYCTRVVERSVEVVVDEWTYDFGRQRFPRYLTFEQNRLVRVDTGSYGNE